MISIYCAGVRYRGYIEGWIFDILAYLRTLLKLNDMGMVGVKPGSIFKEFYKKYSKIVNWDTSRARKR